jgi:hypothetical protein
VLFFDYLRNNIFRVSFYYAAQPRKLSRTYAASINKVHVC